MGRIFHPLLFLLARCTKNELIRQIEFLKAENELLRKRIRGSCVRLNPEERARLLKLGQAVGPAVRQLITIVSREAYDRWRRQATGKQKVRRKTGRPRTAEAMRDLIVRIGAETGWGYTRVMGEIKKLGFKPPSRSTVKRILNEHKLGPGSKPPGTWNEFLAMHAETLWQADFFSKLTWTREGVKQLFVLVFLHVGSRRVFVSPSTFKPTAAWVQQQTEAFVKHAQAERIPTAIVMRDRDKKYPKRGFDGVLRDAGIQVRQTTFRSPNLQAYVERFIQSAKRECLEHFILCGKEHVDYLLREYVDYYHHERPHQAKANLPPVGDWPEASGEGPSPGGEIVCQERLGGLLKSYQRRVAA